MFAQQMAMNNVTVQDHRLSMHLVYNHKTVGITTADRMRKIRYFTLNMMMFYMIFVINVFMIYELSIRIRKQSNFEERPVHDFFDKTVSEYTHIIIAMYLYGSVCLWKFLLDIYEIWLWSDWTINPIKKHSNFRMYINLFLYMYEVAVCIFNLYQLFLSSDFSDRWF